MDPFTEVRKLAGSAGLDPFGPPTLLSHLDVNLWAYWGESACAERARWGPRGPPEAGRGFMRMNVYEQSLESALKGGREELQVSPGYCGLPLWSGTLAPQSEGGVGQNR